MIAPVFESISKSKPNISFLKIDVDNLPVTAQLPKINSVPTFMFMNGSKPVAQVRSFG
jgi:thiol-disulfide isomerase/thioredoxin